MKHLLLITVFLAAMSAKLIAQENVIVIKGLEKNGSQKAQYEDNFNKKENHEFEIVAKEDVDIAFNVKLKEEGKFNLLVSDKNGRIVLSRTYEKKGTKKIDLTMNKNEKYIVKLIGDQQSKMIVEVLEN